MGGMRGWAVGILSFQASDMVCFMKHPAGKAGDMGRHAALEKLFGRAVGLDVWRGRQDGSPPPPLSLHC